MIYDRATRLLPSERAIAFYLAMAVHRAPQTSRLAADLLADVIMATTAAEVYASTYTAVMFATGVLAP